MIAIPANFQLRKHMLQQARSVKVLGGGNVFKVHAWGFFLIGVRSTLFSIFSHPCIQMQVRQ
jgi:hypothetical protein